MTMVNKIGQKSADFLANQGLYATSVKGRVGILKLDSYSFHFSAPHPCTIITKDINTSQ